MNVRKAVNVKQNDIINRSQANAGRVTMNERVARKASSIAAVDSVGSRCATFADGNAKYSSIRNERASSERNGSGFM